MYTHLSPAVRVSKEPGCTKNINYFAFTKKSGAAVTYFVDLPGYGYARKSREDRAKWNGLIKDFLMVRDISVLRRVYILIDGRRGPSEMDGEMMETLTKAALTHQVIITKADLLTDLDLRKTLEATMTEIMKPKRHACLPIVHVLSAKTNYGILPLMQSIAEINSDKWDNNSQPGQSENPPASQVGNQ
ncbi:engB [Symbiodinium microadriaticum]|nr:engB [Symbiodinium microadriaticum]